MLGTGHVRQDGHSSLHMLEQPWEIDIKFPEFICSHCGTLALNYEFKCSVEVSWNPSLSETLFHLLPATFVS